MPNYNGQYVCQHGKTHWDDDKCKCGESLSRAWQEGDAARSCGIGKDMNPHADGEDEFYYWNCGWEDESPNDPASEVRSVQLDATVGRGEE